MPGVAFRRDFALAESLDEGHELPDGGKADDDIGHAGHMTAGPAEQAPSTSKFAIPITTSSSRR